MPCMEYEAVIIFFLSFLKRQYFGNKNIRVGAKIRVGTVLGNEHFFKPNLQLFHLAVTDR